MLSLFIKQLYRVVMISVLWVFIFSYFGKYAWLLVYHLNLSLYLWLGGMLAVQTIRLIDIFILFSILTLIFKPKF